MSTPSSYISRAKSFTYELQSLYYENGQGGRVCVELKELGTKRVLVMCRDEYASYRNVVEFINKLTEAGLRVFNYSVKKKYASSSDILGALDVYRGYNCDTIVVFGGGAEIFCAKLVSAMAVNDMKDPVEAEGFGKIKKDISVLCCVGTDNSTAISSGVAEFMDENTGRWVTVISNYLVPQIAVIDTDIAMRTLTNVSIASAIDTLAMSIECLISPVRDYDQAYKACALNAITLVTDNLLDMKDNPDDGYLRKKIALAGVYAGTAVRMIGLGVSHLIIHAMKTRFGPEYGDYYFRVLRQYINIYYDSIRDDLAEVYDKIIKDEVRPGYAVMNGIPEPRFSAEDSATAMIELLDELYVAALPESQEIPPISKKDIHSIFEEIKVSAAEFGFAKLDEASVTRVLEGL